MFFSEKGSSSLQRSLAGHNRTVPSTPLKAWDWLYSDGDLINLAFGPKDSSPPTELWDYNRDFTYWDKVRICSDERIIMGKRGEQEASWNAQFLQRLEKHGLKLIPAEFINIPEGHSHIRGPTKAPRSKWGGNSSITWLDSHIVWYNDLSWITFFGSD